VQQCDLICYFAL